MLIDCKAPTVVVVSWNSGHNLNPDWHPGAPELRAANGALIAPIKKEDTYVELHTSTAYYVLRPGSYQLFNGRHPTVKTLRSSAPKLLTGAVTSDLDASTDANDDRGRTSETWQIKPPDARPYFVFVGEHAPDSADDLSIRILDEQGRWIGPAHTPNPLVELETELVSGALWIGPLTGPSTLVTLTRGTLARRYSLRLVPGTDAPSEIRNATLGTVITGTLGPTHSRWDDVYGWVEIIDFATEGEQTLYAVVWSAEDSEHLPWPDVDVRDEDGRPVSMKPLWRKTGTRYEQTVAFATEKPHRGRLRIAIRSRSSSGSRASSGSYALCVAADATSCLAKTRAERPVLW
jgi:hypothetical protein